MSLQYLICLNKGESSTRFVRVSLDHASRMQMIHYFRAIKIDKSDFLPKFQ